MPQHPSPKDPGAFILKYFREILFNSSKLPKDAADLVPKEGDWENFFNDGATPHLLMGRYTRDQIMEALEDYGLLPKLRLEGIEKVLLELELSDMERQQLFLYNAYKGKDRLLAELHLHPGQFITDSPFAGEMAGKRYKMLYIQWLCLQHPGLSFTSQRPALPGQNHPGLKMGRQVMALLFALAEQMGMDGIINVPEFPHTAVIYSRRFRFLNPGSEGILKAFQRDMEGRSLAEGSWGIITGCVRHTATYKPKRWFQEEQILPVSDVWIEHFKSDYYRRKRDEALEAYHFIFDEEKWARVKPLNPDGSPKNREAHLF